MRRREFNGVPTVSPVGLGLGFSEKRCPPRPFNLAIRGNHFREFPGTRRPPPTPVLSMKSKRGVRFQSKRGLAVKIGIFGFIGYTRGWSLKLRRRALSDTPVTLIGDPFSTFHCKQLQPKCGSELAGRPVLLRTSVLSHSLVFHVAEFPARPDRC